LERIKWFIQNRIEQNRKVGSKLPDYLSFCGDCNSNNENNGNDRFLPSIKSKLKNVNEVFDTNLVVRAKNKLKFSPFLNCPNVSLVKK